MTTTTGAPWNLRKPSSTDTLASIDDQVRNLADDVDAALDTVDAARVAAIAGTNAAVAAGASVTIPAGNNVYKRAGSAILVLRGWTLTAAKGAGGQLAVVPAGYRPVADVYFVVYNHTGVTFNFGVVQPDGQVLIGNAQASGSALYASVTLPL